MQLATVQQYMSGIAMVLLFFTFIVWSMGDNSFYRFELNCSSTTLGIAAHKVL